MCCSKFLPCNDIRLWQHKHDLDIGGVANECVDGVKQNRLPFQVEELLWRRTSETSAFSASYDERVLFLRQTLVLDIVVAGLSDAGTSKTTKKTRSGFRLEPVNFMKRNAYDTPETASGRV